MLTLEVKICQTQVEKKKKLWIIITIKEKNNTSRWKMFLVINKLFKYYENILISKSTTKSRSKYF